MNHPLSVAAMVKGIRAITAQKWQVEKMKIRGREDEDRLSLFRSHSHRHSRRWLEGSNQEAENESVGTSVRRQTSVLLAQRAAPCCLSERSHVVESMVQLLADSLVLELLSV